MSEEYITLQELSEEIYKEQISDKQTMNESFRRSISNKYNFLVNRIVMRSKLDWRYKNKDRIPLRDKSIVKALLIKSYLPKPDTDDELFVKWFNNSIEETDFETIINLGFRVESLIKDEVAYDDWDLDDVTIDEWVNAIHSSINFSRALSVKEFAYEMIQLYDASNVLNHDIPFGDLIRGNEYGQRSYIWKGLHPSIDTSLPLNEVLKGCFSQEDYANIVMQFMHVILQDSQDKTIDFIKAYAELKKKTGYSCADEMLDKESLASEYTKFFQNIYDYLYDRPELTKDIENEIGTENLLNFFKMKDRNAKNPKKANKDK
ncbi:hypothetical protein [Ruminococcus sp. XPD3002]|uniref:hypothetical protein n=1 Tax=Ruminococcus sp. XPD3002 TaxID=1452269 RepID=UPI0009216B33|nr:hypothetical protein SAMN04487832_101201 [Ruminococcus flavefaciens]